MIKQDILFHVASKRKWREQIDNGWYRPPEGAQDQGIECVDASKLKEHVNRKYGDRKKAILLVVDRARLVNRIRKDEQSGHYIVEEGINTDAILDRISLTQNEEGIFDIEVTGS